MTKFVVGRCTVKVKVGIWVSHTGWCSFLSVAIFTEVF